MAIGVVGRKLGMTRIFTPEGVSIPVSVIEVEPNRVTQVRTLDVDGYCAVQVTTGERRPIRVKKPQAGHFAKAGVAAGRGLWEFRLDSVDAASRHEVGGEIKVDQFAIGQMVDVTGTSIGKGFQGAIKRYHFSMQDATHGNSRSHRAPGSIGQRQTPGRVFPGKKMAGHMGNVRTTARNLRVIQVDVDRNLLLVRGTIPGCKGGDVLVHLAAVQRGKE